MLQIFAISADNAKNIDCAVDELQKEPGFRYVIRERCAAHVLDIVCQCGLDNFSTVKKVRKIVKFLHLSPVAFNRFVHFQEDINATLPEVHRQKPRRIPLDVPTRWNSTYLMLVTAFPVKDAINRLTTVTTKLSEDVMTDFEWIEIEAFTQFLEPFYNDTLMFESDDATISCVLPTLIQLRKELDIVAKTGKFHNPQVPPPPEKTQANGFQ